LQASSTAFANPEPSGYPASAREELTEASPVKPVAEPFWREALSPDGENRHDRKTSGG
jgi:hypothetical protein